MMVFVEQPLASHGPGLKKKNILIIVNLLFYYHFSVPLS